MNYLKEHKPIITQAKCVNKYTFPALLTAYGWYVTLDGTQKLIHSIYYKYDDGSGENLSDEEKIYNTWSEKANENFHKISNQKLSNEM